MNQQASYQNQKFNKTITTEQLNQIVEAILAGKYSWACVLLLRCSGYNPLHYIPYRTYNRLVKENCQVGNTNQDNNSIAFPPNQSTIQSSRTSGKHLTLISDLPYVEDINEQNQAIRGGKSMVSTSNLPMQWLSKFQNYLGCHK